MNPVIISYTDLQTEDAQPHIVDCMNFVGIMTRVEPGQASVEERTLLVSIPDSSSVLINAISALSKELQNSSHANIRVYGTMVEAGLKQAHELSSAASAPTKAAVLDFPQDG